MTPAMTRREALLLLAAAGGSLRHLLPAELRAEDVTDRFARALDAEAVRELGRRYLALAPAEASPAALRAALAAGRRPGERDAAFVARMVREDFAAGRVVELRGWHLSRTEGRILAAVSLL